VARSTQTLEVDGATAEALLRPRRDLVVERAWTAEDEAAWRGGPTPAAPAGATGASFALERGPMHWYRRDVEVEAPGDDGRRRVTETTRFRLALGPWSVAALLPARFALRRVEGRDRDRVPVWAPPDRLDRRAGTVLGVLLSLALVTGYLGTVITQTVSYAASEFGRGTTAQSGVLAAARVGVLGSLVLVGLSDRRGRRRLLLGSVVAGCGATVVGAFSPSMEVLGATQAVARGFSTAAALLLVVVAAEEMPAGARAYALSVMAMAGALGAGVALWVLPLADRGAAAWRILYVVAALGIPVALRAGRRLPESQRFARPHRAATVVRGHGRRLWSLSMAFFCASAFAAPSSQLLIEFLRDERGFSAARISLFTVLTSTPAGLGLVAGGRLADTRGRRLVVAVGVGGGSLVGAWGFTAQGWPMWVANLVATMLAALALPALRAYGPELFPTAARGRANGIVEVVSVAGSAAGLLVAGIVADRTGRLADGMLWLLPLGLLVAVLALTVFPETARRELEDINPEDAEAPDPAGPLRPPP